MPLLQNDTNVLLYMMIPTRPHSDEALAIARMADSSEVRAFICASSLKDVYYITRKYADDTAVRAILKSFMMMFEVVPVDRGICEEALISDEPDYEDGIVRAAAEMARADVILARDKAAFGASWVPSMEPYDYLDQDFI